MTRYMFSRRHIWTTFPGQPGPSIDRKVDVFINVDLVKTAVQEIAIAQSFGGNALSSISTSASCNMDVNDMMDFKDVPFGTLFLTVDDYRKAKRA